MLTFRARVYWEWIAETHQFINTLKRAIIINTLLYSVHIREILVSFSFYQFMDRAAHKSTKKKNATKISPIRTSRWRKRSWSSPLNTHQFMCFNQLCQLGHSGLKSGTWLQSKFTCGHFNSWLHITQHWNNRYDRYSYKAYTDNSFNLSGCPVLINSFNCHYWYSYFFFNFWLSLENHST